jgi:hypothetical protein
VESGGPEELFVYPRLRSKGDVVNSLARFAGVRGVESMRVKANRRCCGLRKAGWPCRFQNTGDSIERFLPGVGLPFLGRRAC